MTEPEITEIIRAVPLSSLQAMDGLPDDLAAKIETMLGLGATVVDIATVLVDGGWQLIIVPNDEHEYEEEMIDESMGEEESLYMEHDHYSEEEEGNIGFVGLLDRLRSLFGKSVSFEAENQMISRNRKRASARQPHEFVAAVWSTRKGVVRCRLCGGPQPGDGELCAAVVVKDGMGMPEMGNEPSMDIGELTLRQATLAQAHDLIEDTLGCWPQRDAHYMDENPFLEDGIACVNCVAFCAESESCCWVDGPISPDGLCKLWIIPDSLHKSESDIGKMIVEVDGKYEVRSEDGSKLLGTYTDRAAAEQRLAEVERFSKAETYSPPKGVIEEGKRALAWIAEGHAGGGFTDVGRKRASQLAAGDSVSIDTIKRMASYLARHSVDKQGEGWSPGDKGYPSPGRVAWAAWGGDPAVSWTRGILDSLEKDGPGVSDVHVDVPLGSGGKQPKRKPAKPMIDNTTAVASQAIPSVFAKADERRFTLGPWYVPDQYDAHGEWTDATELQTALWDYVRSGDRQIRLQHNVDVVAGEWVEALTWPYPVTVPMFDVELEQTVEHEFPSDTVFMGVIWEPWAWELVKQGKIRGYSMGGAGQRVTVDLPAEAAL